MGLEIVGGRGTSGGGVPCLKVELSCGMPRGLSLGLAFGAGCSAFSSSSFACLMASAARALSLSLLKPLGHMGLYSRSLRCSPSVCSMVCLIK